MNQEKIGKFIAKCRKDKNLTQAQLAEKLNMSDKSISKWETGKGMPDSSVMLDLCNCLNITVNELLSGEYLKEEEYRKKVTENLLDITKKSEKNEKEKNRIIIALSIFIIIVLVIVVTTIIYNNVTVSIEYDDRLIKCEITDNDIICTFNGLSLITMDSEKVYNSEETTYFVNAEMLLKNKTRSHFETWDSMAQLNNESDSRFKSEYIIDNIPSEGKVKVYYTNISLKEVQNANQEELNEIINMSTLIAERD